MDNHDWFFTESIVVAFLRRNQIRKQFENLVKFKSNKLLFITVN